ncbi:MAG TPA: phosphate ABC transporter substrate-binding protein PstS [Pseudonocardiaceae bacterium]
MGLAAGLAAVLLSGCGADDDRLTRRGGGGPVGTQVDCGGKTRLTAEGSSAQKGAVDAFIAAYQAQCRGKDVAYAQTGSGAGIRAFTAGQVDFAGTDTPLSHERGEVDAAAHRCQGNPAWNLPLVFGPIAVAYRLDGVPDLVLDAAAVAGIFTGRITRWDHPVLAALNPGARLPGRAIAPVVRSEESGTSENFQRYLAAAAPSAWNRGTGKAFDGGVGLGRETSAGVAEATASTNGGITYVELSFARAAGLDLARIDTGAGPVTLTAGSVGRAVDQARIIGPGNDMVLDLESIFTTTAADAYPILLTTYEVVCSRGYDAATALAVRAFLTLAATDGQRGLADAGYAPLPSRFQQRLLTAIKAIH